MPKIRVISFDVYGTILCSGDHENAMPPRQGFTEFILRAKNLGIKTVTSSDADLDNLHLDLSATFQGRVPFGIEVFDAFFQLSMRPKNYNEIIESFNIKPEELMIIGDNPINDFEGAPIHSTKFLIPPYQDGKDRFSFSELLHLLNQH